MKRPGLALLSLAIALPAMAADNLSKGCDYYNHGQYDKALAYLQDVTSKKPRAWQGHYYLANTYLALGQRDNAYAEYMKCRSLNPTPDVAASCDKIVSQIASHAIRHSSMPSYSAKYNRARQEYVNANRQYMMERVDADNKRLLQDRANWINSGQSVAQDKANSTSYATAEQKQRAREMLLPTADKVRDRFDENKDRMREMK